MNTIPKVLLIVLLPILLVGVVWFYYSDSEAKLPALDESITASYNSYMPDADKLFDKSAVEELSDDNLLDTLRRYINRVEIFSGEDKISQEKATTHYQQLIDAYSSIFVDRTESYLSSPQESWPKAKLRGFKSGISEIERLTNNYDVSNSYSSQCNKILATLSLYYRGWGVINHPKYKGLSNLQNNRTTIRECQANEYIKNNRSFNAQLAKVPDKLRDSHSKYVESQCYNLLDQMEDPYVESYSRYSQRERSAAVVDRNRALKDQIDQLLSDYRSAWGTEHSEYDFYNSIDRSLYAR